ncbi:MAG: toll/interleukin-1 receptor domain-containing protein [Desulfosarcina sp.]|nr:toll/interleukin-1 receptor domain-containing protein [Desulfobacterales bacterium]
MDAFISHASEDADLAIRVEKFLEQNGLKVWLDRSDIRLGVLLREELQAQIRNSRTLVLLWSAPASDSRWVAAEIMMAFHLGRFIIPCVVDDTPVPHFLRNTVFLDLQHDENDASRRLGRAVREPPAGANKLPPIVRSPSAKLDQTIRAVSGVQMKELSLIGKGDFNQAIEMHTLVDETLQRAGRQWRLDPMIINLNGYHCKNAYMLKHWNAICAGRPPQDPVLAQGESYFFEALYVNPNDLSAVNGLGSILFYELELEAAEFFVQKAIDLARQQGLDYSASKHDLALIRRHQKLNTVV